MARNGEPKLIIQPQSSLRQYANFAPTPADNHNARCPLVNIPLEGPKLLDPGILQWRIRNRNQVCTLCCSDTQPGSEQARE
jgi:hypothetical protein